MLDPARPVSTIHRFSWEEIAGLARLLADRLADARVDGVVGIARSGLVPAVMLSHMLGVRPFAVLDIARTHSDAIRADKSQPANHGALGLERMRGRRVLLVDDVVGQGLTLDAACRVLVQAGADPVTATLVVNRDNLAGRNPRAIVDHWACDVHGWVIFPWEGKDPWEGSVHA
ncbi:purine phosphoribosyltransferase [Sphingomonas ginsenosidivorax]|uniref:Purine phosphoribosyltransferase n=1 Tax=Sphingomonas ginsenosidivorax TaxID=862135 RepID=A0A5C6UHJ3_9SPHN|nr:phosphoribosyltransferase family protein [Sphingomonas ginsenosidivorax]TXC71458.1 purine phosphoribosyltransferase [Sphingomonas ginsenosidivorax]